MLSRNNIYAISVGVGIVLALGTYAFFVPKNELANIAPVTTDTPRVGWKIVKEGDPPYSVSFPATATHETQDLKSPDGKMTIVRDTYMAQADPAAVYFLQILKYSISLESNTDAALRLLIDGMVQTGANNKLVSSKFITILGLRGMDFEINDSVQNISYRGRVLIKDNILYQIYLAYDTKKFSQSDFDYFLNSFRVL